MTRLIIVKFRAAASHRRSHAKKLIKAKQI